MGKGARAFAEAIAAGCVVCGATAFVTADPNPMSWEPPERAFIVFCVFVWWLLAWMRLWIFEGFE